MSAAAGNAQSGGRRGAAGAAGSRDPSSSLLSISPAVCPHPAELSEDGSNSSQGDSVFTQQHLGRRGP